jgi:hypothetical protein
MTEILKSFLGLCRRVVCFPNISPPFSLQERAKNLPQCRTVHRKSHMTWAGKPATDRLLCCDLERADRSQGHMAVGRAEELFLLLSTVSILYLMRLRPPLPIFPWNKRRGSLHPDRTHVPGNIPAIRSCDGEHLCVCVDVRVDLGSLH